MIRPILIFSAVAMLSSFASAQQCVKKVVIEEDITKLSIPIVPPRGLNLIFPMRLYDDETIYNLSTNDIWSYNKAKGTKLVSINYSQIVLERNGIMSDFTIMNDDLIFTIELVQRLKGHCSNYKFVLSGAMSEKIAARNSTAPKTESRSKAPTIESILRYVTDAISSKKKSKRLYIKKKKTLSKAESITVFIDKVVNHGDFNVLHGGLHHKGHSSNDLMIHTSLLRKNSDPSKVYQGYTTLPNSLDANGKIKFTITTYKKDLTKDTSLSLVLGDSNEEVNITW